MLTSEEYVKGQGAICPRCESHDISGESIDIEGHFAYQRVSCNCGASWLDVYELSHYRDLELDDDILIDMLETPRMLPDELADRINASSDRQRGLVDALTHDDFGAGVF